MKIIEIFYNEAQTVEWNFWLLAVTLTYGARVIKAYEITITAPMGKIYYSSSFWNGLYDNSQ